MSQDLDFETAQKIWTSKERPQAVDGIVVVDGIRLEPVGIDADDACELVGLLQDLQRVQADQSPPPLAILVTLLAKAHGPAVDRLDERTPEGIVGAYCGERSAETVRSARSVNLPAQARAQTEWEALDVPHWLFVLRVALALALGSDPGPMGTGVMFNRVDDPGGRPHEGGEEPVSGWFLWTRDGGHPWFDNDVDPSVRAVGAEEDVVRALVLACQATAQGFRDDGHPHNYVPLNDGAAP